MKHRTRLILSLLAVIAVAFMIFLFSAQQGEDSSKLSAAITDWVLRRVIPGYADMTPAERQPFLQQWSLYIRKLAHFSEYTLLAVTLTLFFDAALRHKALWPILLASWLAATLYAGTDELHQMFVAGRGPAVLDVGIDSLGALTGALLTTLTLTARDRRIKG